LGEKKIAFILNKGSGNVLKRASKAKLKQYIEEHTPYPVYETESADEASKIVKDLVAQNYDAVFACGGDGTLNTISAELIHTDTALGIIPFGSGNGFARHHKIPMHWKAALNVYKNYKEVICDTGAINGKHFVNVAGVGYSAHVAKSFKLDKGRGLFGYIRVILKNLDRDSREFTITSEKGTWTGETWTVEFANGTQWGADVYLERSNRMDDNSMTSIIFKKISFLELPFLAFRVLFNLTRGSRYIDKLKGQSFSVEYTDILPMHIDGDFAGKSKGQVLVETVPQCLKVWVPKK
jgi:diacylglycerol kinase (ATP)